MLLLMHSILMSGACPIPFPSNCLLASLEELSMKLYCDVLTHRLDHKSQYSPFGQQSVGLHPIQVWKYCSCTNYVTLLNAERTGRWSRGMSG